MRTRMLHQLVAGAGAALVSGLLYLAVPVAAQEAALTFPENADRGAAPAARLATFGTPVQLAQGAQSPGTGAAPATPQPPAGQEGSKGLLDLPLEQLAEQPVRAATPAGTPQAAAAPLGLEQITTAERQTTTVGQTPAAVFVITPDMLDRSGALTIPEALRMVPGMDVARVDANTWAVTARGFSGSTVAGLLPNGFLANKMLVQVDGRTVYSPLFSSTFWDTQGIMLKDLERVEVIRGPGSTVWGSNAVNGVINIVSKSAKDTQGGLVYGGTGTNDLGFGGARYGDKIGEDLYYRVYGTWLEHGTSFSESGVANDNWRDGQGGFRTDWVPTDADTITVQGDIFGTSAGQQSFYGTSTPPFFATDTPDQRSFGGDALVRWHKQLAEKSDWTLQLYYDRFGQQITDGTYAFSIDTIDLEFQQRFPLTDCQQIIYGLGYRLTSLNFTGGIVDGGAVPWSSTQPHDNRNLYTAFVQDEITLVKDKLAFIVGSKFEHNDFTGFEYQPTGRLLWTPSKQQTVWAAISRAVRTPDYFENDIRFTPFGPIPPTGTALTFTPNPNLKSEDLLAYELGYRAQPTDAFSWDVTAFFNEYRNLDLFVVPNVLVAQGPIPLNIANDMHGDTYGVELAANYKLTGWWRVYGAYTFLVMDLHADQGLSATSQSLGESAEGQSPRHQVYLKSSWDLSKQWQFDVMGRYVDRLVGFSPEIPSYYSLDARLAWRPCHNLEMAIIGQNLLQDHHLEYGAPNSILNTRYEIPRGVYGQATWRW